jgi:two-component system, NtrC family, C4-dicarboxylate transport response regulator DctD
MNPSVILIDDDEEVLDAYRLTLELAGFHVEACTSLMQAREYLKKETSSVVLSDVKMPARDGFAVLREVREIDHDIPVILISGHADVSMALNAMRSGAFDFVEKPADPAYVVELLRRACQHRDLVLSHRNLKGAVHARAIEARIIGLAPAIARLRDLILSLAQVDATVLVRGETGVGKELVARCLHEFGHRAKGPFVAINCAALPHSIIESELFGHEPGSFTGAKERRIGKIELADKGTLFLDEIESMPLEAQTRLLRVIQERKLERVGGNREISVDIRIVSAAKDDLQNLASEGRFREDLAYRLDVVPLHVPALRERGPSDIERLFRHFHADAAARLGASARPIGDLSAVLVHPWRGNVRELRNAAERAALGFPVVTGGATPLGAVQASNGTTLNDRMKAYERHELETALAKGRLLQETAAELGISRKTLYLKLREHGLGTSEPADA